MVLFHQEPLGKPTPNSKLWVSRSALHRRRVVDECASLSELINVKMW